MNNGNTDLATMLDELNLPLAAERLTEILSSPELGNYSPQQLLREVIEPQYIESMNRRYITNLRLSRLINKNAQMEELVTSSARRYNEESAFCREACRMNYRCVYIDYCDLLDELLILSKRDSLERYRKRLKYYARLQLLFIDDFAISRYSEDGIKILYHLIKTRTDLGTSTMFTCQYAPSEWGKQLSDEEGCYGKLDGIRRRLTTGYTVHIERL